MTHNFATLPPGGISNGLGSFVTLDDESAVSANRPTNCLNVPGLLLPERVAEPHRRVRPSEPCTGSEGRTRLGRSGGRRPRLGGSGPSGCPGPSGGNMNRMWASFG